MAFRLLLSLCGHSFIVLPSVFRCVCLCVCVCVYVYVRVILCAIETSYIWWLTPEFCCYATDILKWTLHLYYVDIPTGIKI